MLNLGKLIPSLKLLAGALQDIAIKCGTKVHTFLYLLSWGYVGCYWKYCSQNVSPSCKYIIIIIIITKGFFIQRMKICRWSSGQLWLQAWSCSSLLRSFIFNH